MARFNCVTVLAPAKLNLALDVVGLLPGGYHDLDMTMQAITLYERVVLRRSPYLDLRLPGSLVAPNNKNTAIKAALAFFDYTGLLAGVDITIYKNTPVRAGMAGQHSGTGGSALRKSPTPCTRQVPPIRAKGTSAPIFAPSAHSSLMERCAPYSSFMPTSTAAASALPPAIPARTGTLL